MNVCKNICEKYKIIANPHKRGVYKLGVKRCQCCSVFIKWEGVRCPCCGTTLRTKSRKISLKHQVH